MSACTHLIVNSSSSDDHILGCSNDSSATSLSLSSDRSLATAVWPLQFKWYTKENKSRPINFHDTIMAMIGVWCKIPQFHWKSSTANRNQSGFICFAMSTFVFFSLSLNAVFDGCNDDDDDDADVFAALTQTEITDVMNERILLSAVCATQTGTCLQFGYYDLIKSAIVESCTGYGWCRWHFIYGASMCFFFSLTLSPLNEPMSGSMCDVCDEASLWSNII